MNVIFQISGGIGKTIAATAVCKAIKRKYPDCKLLVISGYPDVFLNNPNVYRAFSFGQMNYFYSDYVDGKEIKVLAHDPYAETDYINSEKHLIKIWCEMFDLGYQNEQPEIYLTDREVQFNLNKYKSDKPIFLIQTNGGAQNQQLKYSWARDIPSAVVLKVVEAFKDKYHIVHLKREDQVGYEFTTPVTDVFRSLVTLVSLSKKRFFMDSFAQHTAAALNLPSTVLWIANSAKVFGYEIHDNISSNPFTKQPELKGAFLQKFDISGEPLQFPYKDESEIFDVEKIIQSLSKD